MTVSITLLRSLVEALIKRAKSLGKQLEEYIVEKVLEDADPRTRADAYVELHQKYLNEAESPLKTGDIVQVSEKYWGAVASLLNAIGELKGWPHYTHRDYSEIVKRLAEEEGIPELGKLFAVAGRLHANSYHGFIKSVERLKVYREDIMRLLDILKKILKRTRNAGGQSGTVR